MLANKGNWLILVLLRSYARIAVDSHWLEAREYLVCFTWIYQSARLLGNHFFNLHLLHALSYPSSYMLHFWHITSKKRCRYWTWHVFLWSSGFYIRLLLLPRGSSVIFLCMWCRQFAAACRIFYACFFLFFFLNFYLFRLRLVWCSYHCVQCFYSMQVTCF